MSDWHEGKLWMRLDLCIYTHIADYTQGERERWGGGDRKHNSHLTAATTTTHTIPATRAYSSSTSTSYRHIVSMLDASILYCAHTQCIFWYLFVDANCGLRRTKGECKTKSRKMTAYSEFTVNAKPLNLGINGFSWNWTRFWITTEPHCIEKRLFRKPRRCLTFLVNVFHQFLWPDKHS